MTKERLSELYQSYGRLVLCVIAGYLLQTEQRDDICKQVFLKLYSCGDTGWSEEQIKAWLLVHADTLAKRAAEGMLPPQKDM